MRLNLIAKIKQEKLEYGVPIWKLPDVILIFMGLINIFVMVVTYSWAAELADDPREAVLLVAVEAALIMIVGNIMVESSKEIIENSKLKKELVHIISHQMRTPTTTIKWNTELLRDKLENKLSKKESSYLNRIYEENENIREMIEEMLTISRIEDKKIFYKPTKFEFEKLIEEIIDALRGYAEIKGVKVVFEEFDKIEAVGKWQSFRAIIMNLTENAIRYSKKGGQVTIVMKLKNDNLIVTIQDEGIGIPKEDSNMIFKKFFRGDLARNFQTEGTGLGLYLVKKSVDDLDGEITFKSELGKGSVFKVVIPLVA